MPMNARPIDDQVELHTLSPSPPLHARALSPSSYYPPLRGDGKQGKVGLAGGGRERIPG